MEKEYPIIGVIGGMSTESSDCCKRMIYDLYRERTQGKQCPYILSLDVNMCQIEHWQQTHNIAAMTQCLQNAAEMLSPADFLILCTNTMHEFVENLQGNIPPLLDIRDITAQHLTEAGYHNIGLLGTEYTMKGSFYRERLEKHGLKVIIPDEKDIAVLMRIIYTQLIKGDIRPESAVILMGIIQRLKEKGAEIAVEGCTELRELEIDNSCIPVVDTTELLAKAAVEKALEKL